MGNYGITLNKEEKEIAKTHFKKSGLIFGLKAWTACWRIHVMGLIAEIGVRDYFIQCHEKQYAELVAKYKQLEEELIRSNELNKEMEATITEALTTLSDHQDKIDSYSVYVVEHYDPSMDIFNPPTRCFSSKQGADEYYEKIKKNFKPQSSNSELILYKRITLKKVAGCTK